MESLEDKIKVFLSVSDGHGFGSGDGSGDGDGHGHGFGYGDGSGDCDCDGYGHGFGEGFGFGDGSGDGSGDGHGFGEGDGSGYGSGSGDGFGVRMFQGKRVYNIDDVSTIIESIHGNIANGYILNADFTLNECYVAKAENRYFAHGNTPREAFRDAQSKAFKDMPEEKRIESFVKKFPTLDTIVKNSTLFDWHNRLTGSCEMGRRSFAQQHGIDVENGQMSVRGFIELTKDSYGGYVIEHLLKTYQ